MVEKRDSNKPSKTLPLKVLIIGGGIGGLTLAQVLRKGRVNYEIFERDAGGHARVQGWAVALSETLPRFKQAVPTDLPNLRRFTSVSKNLPNTHDQSDSMSFYDGRKEDKVFMVGGVPERHKGEILRANRADLRKWLLQNLEVKWNKRFDSYEINKDGKVIAFFEDGTSAEGDLLVGADGTRSRVRSQVIKSRSEDLPSRNSVIPVISLVGEAVLPPEVYTRHLELGLSMYNVKVPDGRFFVGLRSIAPDASSAVYYWFRDYRPDDFEAAKCRVASASREELHQKALDAVPKHPSALRELVEITGPKGMHCPPSVQYEDFLPPAANHGLLPDSVVTLLGDASHAMAPARGSGADTAVADALDLGEQIVGLSSMLKDREEAAMEEMIGKALKIYEAKMIPRGREMVMESRDAALGKSY